MGYIFIQMKKPTFESAKIECQDSQQTKLFKEKRII